MLFKVDENLPVEAVDLLRAAGHDALSIHDQQMVGSLDSHVASVCKSEGRALITLDLDFSDIRTYSPGQYPGIIVLRPRNQAKPTVLQLLIQMLPLLKAEPLTGNLWIVQETGLRIREG